MITSIKNINIKEIEQDIVICYNENNPIIKDGKIKTRNQIIIIKDGMQTINPSEELILSDGWIEYVPQINESSIETLKKLKIDEVLNYDSSDSVNTFFMNDIKICGNCALYRQNKGLLNNQPRDKEITALILENI